MAIEDNEEEKFIQAAKYQPLKFAARPKEITVEQLFPTGNYLNIRVGMTWSVGDENPTDVMKAAMDIANNFHRQHFPKLYDKEGKPLFGNYTGEEAEIQQQKSSAKIETDGDPEFEALKAKLSEFEYQEDAAAYLETTEFKYTVIAKQLVNQKPKNSNQ